MASLDDIFSGQVGALGRWQCGLFLLVTMATNAPLIQFSQFATITPPHVCSQPDLEAQGWTTRALRNRSVAVCREFAFQGLAADRCAACQEEGTGGNRSVLVPCTQGWRYLEEEAIFRHSLVQEFDLVCSRKMLIPLSSMTFMFGMGIGYVVGGWFGDRFGRRNSSIYSGLLILVVSVAVAFSPNIWVLIVLRCLVAVLYSICNLNSHVYCNEVTNAHHRNTYSFFYHFNNDAVMNPFAVVMAYLIQDWRFLHVVLASPCALVLLFFFLVPNSPRWLLVVGRDKEAFEVLTRAAKVNGRDRASTEPL